MCMHTGSERVARFLSHDYSLASFESNSFRGVRPPSCRALYRVLRKEVADIIFMRCLWFHISHKQFRSRVSSDFRRFLELWIFQIICKCLGFIFMSVWSTIGDSELLIVYKYNCASKFTTNMPIYLHPLTEMLLWAEYRMWKKKKNRNASSNFKFRFFRSKSNKYKLCFNAVVTNAYPRRLIREQGRLRNDPVNRLILEVTHKYCRSLHLINIAI